MASFLKKNKKEILRVLSYLFVFVGFSYIIFFISYYIRITNKLEGWFFMLCVAVFYFIVYIALNHILIRRVISNKFLLMVEALLFVSMLTLVASDLSYGAFRDKRNQQRRKSTTVTIDSEAMQMSEQINGGFFEDLREEYQRAMRLNEKLKSINKKRVYRSLNFFIID